MWLVSIRGSLRRWPHGLQALVKISYRLSKRKCVRNDRRLYKLIFKIGLIDI